MPGVIALPAFTGLTPINLIDSYFDPLLTHDGDLNGRKMDGSHLRSSQPPTTHIVPGAPGVIHQPPPHIPAFFLAETIAAIRGESAGQARLMTDQYSSIARGYTEMNTRFDLHVRQTDRIFGEQHARFEHALAGVKEDIRQLREIQTVAIAGLGVRLAALEGAGEPSGDVLVSKLATIAEAMDHGFDRLAKMMRRNDGPLTSENEIPMDSPPLEGLTPLIVTTTIMRSENPCSFPEPPESPRQHTCGRHRM